MTESNLNIGNDSCAGSNALLRDCGYAVSSGWDILSEYIYRYPDANTAFDAACDAMKAILKEV